MKKTFVFELLIPVLLFFAINQIIFEVKPVIRFLDKHRPRPIGLGFSVYFQAQDFHLRALTIEDNPKNTIVFTGSSSVVEGVDVDIVKEIFQQKRFPLHPYNYGLMGLKSYELPLVKDYLLNRKIKVLVYLYNTFGFPQNLPDPESTEHWFTMRWNTFEFLRFVEIENIFLYREVIGGGIARKLFPLHKYDFLVKNYISRFISGTLKPLDYPHTFLPDKPTPPSKRPRILKPKPPENGVWRQLYIQSATDNETISYRNLARFLDLANQQNIKVILAPIPEPEFIDYTIRQGINIKRIDDHVARIAAAKNMIFLPRHETNYIEANDTCFVDHDHMHSSGRNEYSKWLAYKIIDIYSRNH